ncbi:MAG: hypothetical protein JXO22_12935 [Phycisphaerae bacterium]|nr:hypothetical protein [Phycisphaerae bacterium]
MLELPVGTCRVRIGVPRGRCMVPRATAFRRELTVRNRGAPLLLRRMSYFRAAGLICLALPCGCHGLSDGPVEPDAVSVPVTEMDGADIGLSMAPRSPSTIETAENARQRPVSFSIFIVQIPQARRDLAAKVWNYVREDGLDDATTLRLRQNGLRVGVSHEQWWTPIKTAIEAIEGHQSSKPGPWRIPQRYPLFLEMDEQAGERTVFSLGCDGILSGGMWPQSRCALQLTHVLDAVSPNRDVITLVPVVRQMEPGWRRIRAESGMWSLPRYAGRAFPESGFTLGLDPGEFLLVAPSEEATLPNLLGTVFLTRGVDGVPYDRYVFIKPDVMDVDADE